MRACVDSWSPWLIGLVSCCLLGAAQAQPYYGQPYPVQPYSGQGYYAPPYYGQPPVYGQAPNPRGQSPSTGTPAQPATPQYRPVSPSNAQGVPPTYRPSAPSQPSYGAPGYPSGWPSSYAQPSGATQGSAAPSLSWSLVESAPYLQQPVILTLELVSPSSPSTLDLELPSTNDVLMKTLEGPTTDSRQIDGRRVVVNSFVVTLVPLRTGEFELPAIRALGRWGNGQRFEAATERPVRLQVRPSMSSVRPWLPLESLSLKSTLDREGTLEPGQPVTLILDISAAGATAVQLPSLENQLRGEGFRVYREQTLTDTQASSDRRRLLARRTEYYTLVPQTGGRITLPEMRIAWWNVERGVREVTRLPLKTLNVRGGVPFGLSQGAFSASVWLKVWLPLGALLLLVAGYWVGVLYRGRPFKAGADLLKLGWRGLVVGLGLIGALLRRYLGWTQGSLRGALRSVWYRSMSPGSRILQCVRRANRAETAAEWCHVFETESRVCLSAHGDFTQSSLIRQIPLYRPGVDPAVLKRLMDELDAARFAHRPLDFARWKRDLMRQIGRRAALLHGRRAGGRVRWAALPELNPR